MASLARNEARTTEVEEEHAHVQLERAKAAAEWRNMLYRMM